MQCGCTYCDGSGMLLLEEKGLAQLHNECPECEGHGFLLDTTSISNNSTGLSLDISRVIPISSNHETAKEQLRQAA